MFQIQHLQKVGAQSVLLDIEALTVPAGEIAAVMGLAGSGMDVLLDLLTGRTHPTAGTVRVVGVDPCADHATFSRAVGVLFAEDSLYPRRTAHGNLDFFRRLRNLPKTVVPEVLARVGLADCANTRLGDLPSGLQRRLAFGSAILHQPQALLLVAPFARCDEASVALLKRLIREEAAHGAAILILAGDAAHLEAFCDAIYNLNQGRLSAACPPEPVISPALPFKIPVKLEEKIVLVNPGDILFAVAQEGRTYLHLLSGPLPAQFTLAELEERLRRSGFFRAHRAYLVNLQHVKEVIPYTRNAYTLILDDAAATRIPLSKASAAELRELLGI